MHSLRQTARSARHAVRDLANRPRRAAQTAIQHLETRHWEKTRYRPEFNADSFLHAFPKAAISGTGPVVGGRIAVRIAFHYVPARLKYLVETVDAVRTWPFRDIDIFIDTNSEEFAGLVDLYVPGAKARVWSNLENPFKLTWTHRRAFLEQADDYDTFAYIEDNIALPRNTMRRWLLEYDKLVPHGYLPGFLRVEASRDGTLYLSDFRGSVERRHIIEVDGGLYLDSPYPYQGCWICHKDVFSEFKCRDSYLGGASYPPKLTERDGQLGVREQVAVGPAFDDIPPGRISRMLIPLDGDGNISADTLIAHTPSNYARLKDPHPAMLGTVRLDQALI